MKILKANMNIISKRIRNQDLDHVHVNFGYEGIGKSTLGLWMCSMVDPDFNVDKIVFDLDQFKNAVLNSKKGEAIMIDEGGLMFFSRDAMTRDVKTIIKIFTACRQYNLFICINSPSLQIIDKYIREHRVKTVSKVTSRGNFKFWGQKKTKQIKINRYTGQLKFGKANFKERFPQYPNDKLWQDYLQKKGTILKKESREYIPVMEYAKKKGISHNTVYNYIRDKKIPYILDSVGRKLVKRK